MAVNWLSALVMTGLLLISVFAAALAGYVLSRKHSRSASQNYFWDDDEAPNPNSPRHARDVDC